ncbi:uncharacterized protein EV154DRAFT_483478 [Mucor mucedo]|uniref:uncharacterized protein n=1 Tax=Mucor mucedo TaxID=29922 RepID=UPI0022202570|nr:uncharacterized protein EV154DRAFT_483478 [Mucor mucedo]KAI7889063.1 hypothetical protein EV154DRAFT_483478 [Mucor mucedo]
MDFKVTDKLLSHCVVYTINNTIAERDKSNNKRSAVVTLKTLDENLQQAVPTEYEIMMHQYSTLLEFLLSKNQSKKYKEWIYEVVTINQYNQDSRRLKNSLTRLQTHIPFSERLFIIYQNEAPEVTDCDVKLLTNSILAYYKEAYLELDEIYKTRREIRNKVNIAIKRAFFELDVSVELVRSSHTELDFADDFVNMGIRFPPYNGTEADDYAQYRKKHERLYNNSYISWYLEKVGMIDVHPENQKFSKSCVFVDPSGLTCKLLVDDGMLFEREELFKEYLKLDERIRPLIRAIFYFATCQKLNKSAHDGFLTSYSYIVMILYFLMKKLNYPVIPCIQDNSITCNFPECLHKNNGKTMTRVFAKKLRFIQVRYHTCVSIKKKDESHEIAEDKKTIWISENTDDLGTLLIKFFDFYSTRKHFSPVSISKASNISERSFSNQPAEIQDPFISILYYLITQVAVADNILRAGCKSYALDITIDKFIHAANLLKSGHKFQDICQI